MQKIEVSLEDVVEDIKEFYDERVWHFLTLNGLFLKDDKLEIQWIFAKYGSKNETVIFYTEISHGDTVPSIVGIIPSAIISQREVVDMFGIIIEGSEKGLYLDEDSMQAPLSGCAI